MKKIKVLIIDDSAVTRKVLSDALSKFRSIEVVGTALDPFIAVNKIKKLEPDVLTLDIEMPRMDGLTFLSKLMNSHPMPVIMVSGFTDAGAEETIKALELGAVDFILKPKIDDLEAWQRFSEELSEKITAASISRIKRRYVSDIGGKASIFDIQKKFTSEVIRPPKAPRVRKPGNNNDAVIAIGASTGGTEIITEILCNLSEDVPGIVIVQHMPEKFTKAFADRVNRISKLDVKEGKYGDRLNQGVAIIAPGNKHMILRKNTGGYFIKIDDGLPVNRHKPSIDVLFHSVAQVAAQSSLGILLTGMGADGAEGLLEIKKTNITTIAQNEETCVIFGMPKEAIKLGAADMVFSTSEIIKYINELFKR